MIYYTKTHEWVLVKTEEKVAFIGISDHAQNALGDITFVGTPAVDKVIKQGQFCAEVESVKAASDVYAPIGGRVGR